jgi:phosphate transport system permease protein
MSAATLRPTSPRRRVTNAVALGFMGTAVLLALIPLGAVISYTVSRGIGHLNVGFLTHSMRGVTGTDRGGGAYHAIIGTLEQVGLAGVMSVPLGVLVAIYLVEYGAGRLAGLVRFVVDVMTGVPSIVAGLFIYAFWVLALHRGFSGLAAAFALTVLMLPIVVRSCEEMLKLVPDELREASYALGVPRHRTILRVVLPAASAGITTGVMLAVARVTGETAPLLLTAAGLDSINANPFKGQQASLPLLIFQGAGSPFAPAVQRAWAGALTLIVIVLLLTLIARLLTRRNRLVR